MDAAVFEQLLTPSGQRLLGVAMTSYGDIDPLLLNERLRELDGGYPAELVAAALTQVTLRHAAASKFGAPADQMYFTPAGLEQATHPIVAAHRAARALAAHPDGARTAVDLGCGVGSDLLAFARTGHAVVGVDVDGLTAAVAGANLVALGLPGTVRVGRAEDVNRREYDLVFADPARRTGSARVFDPRAFSPDWDFVLELLSQGQPDGRAVQAVVKLAPGLDHALIPSHVEAEWVSLDGDLKEAVLWAPTPSPAAAESLRVRRRATVLGSYGAHATCTDVDAPGDPAPVSAVGGYLYEPDAAVIRAHLVSTVARDVGGWLLDPHIAYISSDRAVETPLARGFRVLETLPYREKALRSALRTRGIGSLTIKKRGVAVTPEGLRQRLALRGPARGTLVLSRTPGSAVALLVEPFERDGQPPAG